MDAPPHASKGKAKDTPPVLPPLAFAPTAFDYRELCPSPSLISEPGPSSYGSLSPPQLGHESSVARVVDDSAAHNMAPIPAYHTSRRRSLSNPPHRYSDPHVGSSSRPRVRIASPRGPSYIAHRLFSSDRRQARSAPNSPGVGADPRVDLDTVVAGSCLFRTGPYSDLVIDRIVGGPIHAQADDFPVYLPPKTAPAHNFKAKGRSNSDPLPLPRAFDVVPVSANDVFAPFPILVPPNLFDGMLPRELRLCIFGFLVQIHEEDHERRVRDGRWTAIKASKHKWVGRNQGVREVVRLSRVCKAWLALIYDGQLWSRLDLRAFPKIPPSQLLQVTDSAGPFITSLNLSGHGSLLSSTLESLTNNLSVGRRMRVAPGINQLINLNMNGCSLVTTPSLHYLLRQSPSLEALSLKGLPAVTNETCEVLSDSCPRLLSLNLSRCKNLTGAGIRLYAHSAVTRLRLLPLTELRLSGLKGITDSTMLALGKAAPYLEILDLSYCRDLHNSSLDAFVACDDDFALESVTLSAREAGRNPNEGRRYRRRITHLRHLSLSYCTLLTDIACSHLAHTMPRLELLELGGVGGELKDDGVVRLLETLPNLRKLDLEDASEITDDVLDAITPPPPSHDSGHTRKAPGHALEHLIVSYAAQLSNDAFQTLIRNCPRLRVLEADSTRLSGTSVREFVRRVRERSTHDATVVGVDCRSVNEAVVRDLADEIRPRLGWRAYEARKLGYLDGRDDEGLGVGQDECDPQRVVLKTFAAWQTVDAVAAARQKRRKGGRRRAADASGGSGAEDVLMPRSRWWSPGGRRSSGMNSPTLLETNNERDGCTIM
ncbi:hypothetical protein BC834DRAFT_814786 [Gloeopeniophorella convolvens]|nr:hypothetical protein BC834DRAFT_814786 [Gloeopeniophorella convolvens]